VRYQNDQLDELNPLMYDITGHAPPVDSWSGSDGQVRVRSGQVSKYQLDELKNFFEIFKLFLNIHL
jgi:hypothetical protein